MGYRSQPTKTESSKAIGGEVMRKGNFALRLQPSLLDEARKLAEAEGVALNQLINVAVAEKVSLPAPKTLLPERVTIACQRSPPCNRTTPPCSSSQGRHRLTPYPTAISSSGSEPPSLHFMKSTLQTDELQKGREPIPTIKRLEAHNGALGGRHETGTKIRLALEAAGIEFIDENGGGPGVRLRKHQRKKS
jgi:hypothetical protein